LQQQDAKHVLRCVECGANSGGDDAWGWRGYRVNDSDELEPLPAVAFYCPRCAKREFGIRFTR